MNINEAELEAIAREVRRLTLSYAALHFDGIGATSGAYASDYLSGLVGAPIDVSGLAATFAAPLAPSDTQGAGATERKWLDRAHRIFLEGMRTIGLGDGSKGWIEHGDEDGELRRDSFSLEGEILFGFEAIKAHIDEIKELDQQAPDAVRDAASGLTDEQILRELRRECDNAFKVLRDNAWELLANRLNSCVIDVERRLAPKLAEAGKGE